MRLWRWASARRGMRGTNRAGSRMRAGQIRIDRYRSHMYIIGPEELSLGYSQRKDREQGCTLFCLNLRWAAQFRATTFFLLQLRLLEFEDDRPSRVECDPRSLGTRSTFVMTGWPWEHRVLDRSHFLHRCCCRCRRRRWCFLFVPWAGKV